MLKEESDEPQNKGFYDPDEEISPTHFQLKLELDSDHENELYKY